MRTSPQVSDARPLRSGGAGPHAPLPREDTWAPVAGRGRVVVTVAMLVLVVLVVVGEVGGASPSSWLVATDVVVGIAGGLALPRLARVPVGGTLGLIACSAISPAAMPLAATATLWLARVRPLGVAVRVALVGATAQVVRVLWRPTPGIALVWWAALVVVAHAALVGWGAWRQAHHALLASLAERARRAEADQAARLDEARYAERTRIAREMHDVLAHRLSLLTTYAGALQYRPDAPPDQVRDAVAVIRTSAHQALDDLRDVIGVLRGHEQVAAEPRRPVGTLDDLAILVDECRQAGMTVRLADLSEATAPDGLPAALGRTAYRVVQEALTNVRKHAPGADVDVVVTGRPATHLDVEVRNAAARPRARAQRLPGSGTGLVGLSERVHLAGGTLRHGATPDGGYRVRAWLPWPA